MEIFCLQNENAQRSICNVTAKFFLPILKYNINIVSLNY